MSVRIGVGGDRDRDIVLSVGKGTAAGKLLDTDKL